MSYDTGSNCLSISDIELPYLVPVQFYQYFDIVTLFFADGNFAFTRSIPGVQVRVLTADHTSEVLGWREVSALVSNGDCRLGSEILQKYLFVCSHPFTMRLYVATRKAYLNASMPAA
jgi:hypothetical protein